MIIASGKLPPHQTVTLGQYPELNLGQVSPLELAINGNEMKPLIFDPSNTLKSYAEASEITNAVFKHLKVDKTQLALSSIMHEDEIFNKPNARDVYIRILKILNPKAILDEVIPLISDDILETLKGRSSGSSCHVSVILLNEPFESLRIDHIKHLFRAVDEEEFFKVGTDCKGRISTVRMDNFTTCMYAFNNSDWVTHTDFSGSSRLTEEERTAIKPWVKENYDFIYRLLMTYFNPTELMEFSMTRGFDFTSFVSLLYLIKDRIDLTYWDFKADLWINLNLIGYNPYKEICNMDKKLNTFYGKKLLSKLNASMVVNYFVSIVNAHLSRFGGQTCVASRCGDHMYYFTQPLEAYSNLVATFDNVDKIKSRLVAIDRKAGMDLFDFSECKSVKNTSHEYSFDVDTLDKSDRPAALAFGYLPAFLSSKSLNFSELNYRSALDLDTPHLFDFFQYLYMHRGWLSKRHPVSIGRGRTIDIHAHTAVLEIFNNWSEYADNWTIQASPNDTFKLGFDISSKAQEERMGGDDFDNLPCYFLPAMDDRFFHIRNAYDLINEGNIMNHCCGGSHYIEECTDNERVFFHYQPDDSEHYNEGVTFDLDVYDNEKEYFRLSSANMHSNKSVPSEMMHEINHFITHLNTLHRAFIKANKIGDVDYDQLAKAC